MEWPSNLASDEAKDKNEEAVRDTWLDMVVKFSMAFKALQCNESGGYSLVRGFENHP